MPGLTRNRAFGSLLIAPVNTYLRGRRGKRDNWMSDEQCRFRGELFHPQHEGLADAIAVSGAVFQTLAWYISRPGTGISTLYTVPVLDSVK